MKRIFTLSFLILIILSGSVWGALYTRTTGSENAGADIPTAYILENGEINISQGFSIGRFEKFNPDKDGKVYSDGDTRISVGLFNFLELGVLFYNERNVVGNLQFRLLKDYPEKTYIPGLAVGVQNISGEDHISPEGKFPEFDHFYRWNKDGDLKTWEEDQFENNSFYIVASKNFKDTLILHLGLGLGRFVGHSGWSSTNSFNDSEIAMFYGFRYRFRPFKDKNLSLSFAMEADGRDWNLDSSFEFELFNRKNQIHLGSNKIEHWFKDVAFQPKFSLGYSITLKAWN